MKVLILTIMLLATFFSNKPQNNKQQNTKSLHKFSVTAIDGEPFHLSSLKGKKVLVVNTASKCGLTPQFTELQELYDKYKENNFIIVGFPANNFMGQEPGTDEQIAEFCSINYGVTFPMMSKISVKGNDKHPLYQWLTQKKLNGNEDVEVSWNFQKFLIDENGYWVKSVPPKVSPKSEEIVSWIEGR